MYTMHEAFARERTTDARRRADSARWGRQARAARRWARLERMAASAHARYERASSPASSGWTD